MQIKAFAAMVVGVLALAPLAQAAEVEVKMGAANGRLVFEPKEVTIKKGDSVRWVFVKAGPHNVMFDKAKVPAGVDAATISHKKLVNKTDPSFVTKFDKVGEYYYFCVPHKGAGMVGEVVVK
jgi:plastocyanin